MLDRKSADPISLSLDTGSLPVTGDETYEWQSDLFLELVMPSTAVHAQLHYRCEKTNAPVALDIRADRQWLESFGSFRLQCARCQAQHIVPAVLRFSTEE